MRSSLFVVFDLVAAQVSGIMWQMPNDAAARRQFALILANPETAVSRSPRDYELRKVGELSLDSGSILAVTTEVVMTGAQWMDSQSEVSAHG